MFTDFMADVPLSYPAIRHRVLWRDDPVSVEYLVPVEDKLTMLRNFSPFLWVPELDEAILDERLSQSFLGRDFKVVHESGMNFIASPFYYRSGATILDTVPVQPPRPECNGPLQTPYVAFAGENVIVRVRPGRLDRYNELLERQNEMRRNRLGALRAILQSSSAPPYKPCMQPISRAVVLDRQAAVRRRAG